MQSYLFVMCKLFQRCLPQVNVFNCYSEFCFAELTERRFSRLVLGLDLNVLSLCFTQRGVNIRTLEPHNTLGNLLAVLNSPELGFVIIITVRSKN